MGVTEPIVPKKNMIGEATEVGNNWGKGHHRCLLSFKERKTGPTVSGSNGSPKSQRSEKSRVGAKGRETSK